MEVTVSRIREVPLGRVLGVTVFLCLIIPSHPDRPHRPLPPHHTTPIDKSNTNRDHEGLQAPTPDYSVFEKMRGILRAKIEENDRTGMRNVYVKFGEDEGGEIVDVNGKNRGNERNERDGGEERDVYVRNFEVEREAMDTRQKNGEKDRKRGERSQIVDVTARNGGDGSETVREGEKGSESEQNKGSEGRFQDRRENKHEKDEAGDAHERNTRKNNEKGRTEGDEGDIIESTVRNIDDDTNITLGWSNTAKKMDNIDAREEDSVSGKTGGGQFGERQGKSETERLERHKDKIADTERDIGEERDDDDEEEEEEKEEEVKDDNGSNDNNNNNSDSGNDGDNDGDEEEEENEDDDNDNENNNKIIGRRNLKRERSNESDIKTDDKHKGNNRAKQVERRNLLRQGEGIGDKSSPRKKSTRFLSSIRDSMRKIRRWNRRMSKARHRHAQNRTSDLSHNRMRGDGSSLGSLPRRLPRPRAGWPSRQHLGSLDTRHPKLRRHLVSQHNLLRSQASPTPADMLLMTWYDAAAQQAQAWAEQCHPKTEPDHPSSRWTSRYGACGQNVYTSDTKKRWHEVVRQWWAGRRHFQYGGTNNITLVASYTQMVWYNSHQLGCGFAQCSTTGGGTFYRYVCNYCPAGNDPKKLDRPYREGAPCGLCPGSCKSSCLHRTCYLCTNACQYSDLWLNCATLAHLWHSWLCNTKTKEGVNRFRNCRATCQCLNEIT